ncbi:GHKL domain-containing protein [Proteobacteria bacterium 005FR1]|nr:GHKL domain-containing protein [Proteobacteria bacterium 005FR1]
MAQYLFAAFIDLLIAAIAISKTRTLTSWAYACLAACFASWSVELFFLSAIDDPDKLRPLFQTFRIGMFFIPPVCATYCWAFVGARSRNFPRFVILPSILTTLVSSLASVTCCPSALRSVEAGYLPAIDPTYYVFISNVIVTLLLSIGFVVIDHRRQTERQKRRTNWLLFALAVGLTTGLASIAFMPTNTYLSKLVGTGSSIAIVTSLFYPTIRNHVMDLKLAIAVWSSRALVLGFFLVSFIWISAGFREQSKSLGGTLAILALVVLALETYPLVIRRIVPGAKRLTGSGNYDIFDVKRMYHQRLVGCASLGALTSQLDELLLRTVGLNDYHFFVLPRKDQWPADPVNSPVKVVRLERRPELEVTPLGRGGVLMKDEIPDPAFRDAMRQVNAGACLCVVHQHRLSAVLVIEGRNDGRYYSYDDIRLFEWLAEEMSCMLDRLEIYRELECELYEAKKRLSLLTVMNHYHHDIKAPLAIIDGIVSQQLYDSEKQRKIILEQVELGSKLITTMAGILKGKRQRQVVRACLDEVLRDCLFLFQKNLADSTIELDGALVVSGDVDDLKIMFVNLIKNALESSRDGQGRGIQVRAWRERECIKVSVADQGTGIIPERLHRIWDEPFTTKPQGNGIGLQAVKRIADEHQATVAVRSEPDRGAEFVLSFPAASQAMPAEEIA